MTPDESPTFPAGPGQPGAGPSRDTGAPRPERRRPLRRVVGRTLGKAWEDDIFSHSAQAAFWQALSLPPLFLALLGSLGYVGAWFGPETVDVVESGIIGFSRRVFTPEVVDQIIAPTADNILTRGRADVVSVGFVVALWAGSSAVASIVDSITDAHGQKLVRHPVWQRIFSLLLYLLALVVAVLTLPIIALGPDLLPQVLPVSWRPGAVSVIQAFYYPGAGLLLVLVLTTLYKLALPHSLPWRRLLPGALLAMVVFIASTTGLRIYIAVLTSTGYTYGALATPIAFLLFAFLLGLSIVLGAHLNNAVEEVWPSRPTRRQRRLHRLLSMREIAARRLAERGDAAAGEPPAPSPGPPGPPPTGTPADAPGPPPTGTPADAPGPPPSGTRADARTDPPAVPPERGAHRHGGPHHDAHHDDAPDRAVGGAVEPPSRAAAGRSAAKERR